MPVNVWTVTAAAAVTALATGLGALPFLFVRNGMGRRWLGTSNAIAAGFMLAASVGLVWQGVGLGPWRVVFGALAGAAFIWVFRRLIGDQEGLVLGRLAGADALKALVIVAVMTVHSASEGVGVGVSYGGGERLGVLITIAIAVHNIPEGLAISLVLVPRGARVRSAAWWSVFSSLPQPLIAPFAFLFVEAFKPVLPAGLGFAAGAMIWMVVSELLPEAIQDAPKRTLALGGGISFAVMLGAQLLLFRT
ncbi:MAG TPA: ZIP family metal transporter [Gaiellaceae bacterium]|nr:ZIP family metal transporter [Gaiellaceae bacterium]